MEKQYSNPAPLGLMGFGMTTVLLNLHNAGVLGATSIGVIFAMGILYGGIAQVIAGVMEFRKGNTFGTTAFTSYGLFWISLVAILLFPAWGWAPAADGHALGAYLCCWGFFSLYMFIGTLKKAKGLQVVFGGVTVLFWLLGIAAILGNDGLHKFAGWEGIFCGASAIYVAMAEVLNEVYDRRVLPV